MNRNTAVAPARGTPGSETSACLTSNGRDGGAILLVLAAAAVTGFLAIGALAAASELHRQELTERAILQAELSAEVVFAERVVGWGVRDAVGASAWETHPAVPPGMSARSLVQPAGAGVLWRLHAVAERTGPGGAAHSLAVRSRIAFLRGRPPSIDLQAPVTVRGALEIAGGALLDATDTPPPGWHCSAAVPPAATAEVAFFSGTILTSPTPPIAVQVPDSMEPATLRALSLATPADPRSLRPTILHGDLAAPSLEASGVSPPGSCPLAAPPDPLPALNWGDPARPSACDDYFPYVHVAGDLTHPTGAGQGILVVDGDLLATELVWAGLVVVRGTATLQGPSVRVHGAVLALGAGPHEISGGAEIHWSSCAIAAAMRAGAVVTPVTGMPWSAP